MKTFEDFIKEHNDKIPNTKIDNKNEKYNELQELDALKTKVLKYVLYKKRTEKEVRQKFSSFQDTILLEEVVENLKQNGYIDDENYIKRAVDEHIAIHTLSLREMRNKLYTKGLNSDMIDSYFTKKQEELKNYEIACAKKIILKKQMQLEKQEVEHFLLKKGYLLENIKIAYEETD